MSNIPINTQIQTIMREIAFRDSYIKLFSDEFDESTVFQLKRERDELVAACETLQSIPVPEKPVNFFGIS